MADPDAARLGYRYNPTKGRKRQYSQKPTYTPSPSQAVGTNPYTTVGVKVAPYKPVTNKDDSQWLKKHKPNGDKDGDGIKNSKDKDPLSNQQEVRQKLNAQITEGLKMQIQKPYRAITNSLGLVGRNPSEGDYKLFTTDSGVKVWYVAVQDPNDAKGLAYKYSHVQIGDKNYTKLIGSNQKSSETVGVNWKATAKWEKEHKKEQGTGQDPAIEGDDNSASPNSTSTGNSQQNKGNGRKNKGGDDKKNRDNNPAKAVGKKENNKNSNKETDDLKVSGNGNGDNILRLFQKHYGAQGTTVLEKTLENYRSSGIEFKEIGKPGQYGYTIAVKTEKGWSTDPNIVKNQLTKYLPTSSIPEEDLNNKLKFVGLKTGGTEKSLSKRFGNAFAGGDTAKGNAMLMTAFENYKKANPEKIRIVGAPGGVGTYIEININGEWTSNSDVVSKRLARFLNTANPDKKTDDPLTKAQKDYLGGANGHAVLNAFVNKYGDSALAQTNLEKAIKAYEKSSPGNDIRVFGKIGQPGFYIEVKTKDGWVNGTNRVLNKLDDYMPKATAVVPPSSSTTPAPPPVTDPVDNTTPAQPPESSSPAPEDEDPTHGLPGQPGDPTGAEENQTDPATQAPPAGTIDSSSESEGTLPVGVEAGTVEDSQLQDRLNALANDRQQETDAFKVGKNATVEVDLGKIAKKSQAMMAFDLDGNGKLSQQEKSLMANGDQNNNGTVGEYGLRKFVQRADTNNSGLVSRAEVKAYNVLDTNNNNKISNAEVNAYKRLDADNDGSLTKKEARQAVKDLRAQVDLSKKEQKELDLAKEYLAKSNGKGGGAEAVNEQVNALVNSQPKHKNKDNDGPGKKKKNKND